MILLTGCTSYREYRAIRRAYRENPMSEYYHHEIADESQAIQSADDAKDPFLAEVERHLLRVHADEEAGPGAENLQAARILPLSPDQRDAFHALANSEDLDHNLREPVSLEQLIGIAYARNFELKAANKRLRATLQRYPQATALDDILNQYNAFTKQLDTKTGPQNHKPMLTMKFPLPNTLDLKGQIIREDVAIAREDVDLTLRNLIAELRNAYYEYRYLNAALEITRDNRRLLEKSVKIAQQQYKVDIGKYQTVIMGQIELSRIRDHLLTLQNKQETQTARINTLMSRDPAATLGAPMDVPYEQATATEDALHELALTYRQEIRSLAHKRNRLIRMIEMAARMAYPDPSLGASYLEDRMARQPKFMNDRDLDENQATRMGKRDAYIREMKFNLLELEDKINAIQDETRFAVKKQYLELDNARRGIELYRQSLLPKARQAFESAQTTYASAGMDFIEFVDTQRKLLDMQLGEQSALRDYRTALAELERLVGRSLTMAAMKPRREGSDETDIREP